MNLEEIKRYDDSVWLYILKQRTVFDTDKIKAQKDWLIEQVESLQKDVQEWEHISDKQVEHLTRNGKEIIKLTEENERLKEAIKDIKELTYDYDSSLPNRFIDEIVEILKHVDC